MVKNNQPTNKPVLPASMPVMTGGAKAQIKDIIKKHWSPIEIYVLVGLVLAIVYVKHIPLTIRRHAETFLGRLVLFVATIAVAKFYSWSNGLLVAIFTLLLLSLSPRRNEGFQDGNPLTNSMKMVSNKKNWFVENLLKEHPLAIEEDKVKTSAIQDGSTTRSSNSGGP